MSDFIIRLFVKDYKNTHNSAVRIKYGKLASVVGIVLNILLCVIKGVTGIIFNSVAIIADAVNNLSDSGNSIISLLGFIISDKPSDEDHPYGHARFEHISCLIVSFFIILLGLSLFKTSVMKIIKPEPINTSYIAVLVLVISILFKLWMCVFYKKTGRAINSDVIIANSKDSLNDVISTSAVLITTLIAIVTEINLDAYAGSVVSVFIIFSGFSILKETVDKLLGAMPDRELVEKIVRKINSYDGVCGIHDLVVHSYGPGKHFATVHVEVPVDEDILSSHDMIDNIERDFSLEMNINLVIHLDPVVTNDEETNKLKNKVNEIIKSIDKDLSMHDFRMVKGETHSNLIFDVAIPASFDKSEGDLIRDISHQVNNYDDKLYTVITVDRNYTSFKL